MMISPAHWAGDSGVEQLAARQAHNLEVAGSNPAPASHSERRSSRPGIGACSLGCAAPVRAARLFPASLAGDDGAIERVNRILAGRRLHPARKAEVLRMVRSGEYDVDRNLRELIQDVAHGAVAQEAAADRHATDR